MSKVTDMEAWGTLANAKRCLARLARAGQNKTYRTYKTYRNWGWVRCAAGAAIMALIAGCSTEIKVNGNYNSIDTSPAKYAGYGSTVDVLKGMSLPSLSLGSSSAKATEDRGKEEKTATDEETKAAELPATESAAKNGGNGVLAEVEAPEAKVTEGKVEVKAE